VEEEKVSMRPRQVVCSRMQPPLVVLEENSLRVPGAVDVQHRPKPGKVFFKQGFGQGGGVDPQAGTRAPDGQGRVH
jgi:hypothetical protein